MWVQDYLYATHSKNRADEILDDIDRRLVMLPVMHQIKRKRETHHSFRRIAIAPPFSGLRRFPEGRGFKQWTGDDSKALMKVSSTLAVV
jgi:hypothetical protein